MTTVKIEFPEHLVEYLRGKYNNYETGPIRFPEESDIYHTLYDLLRKRPADKPVDSGNLELILPERSIGKRPETYNYLSAHSQRILRQKVTVMMWADIHEYIDCQHHMNGVDYKTAVYRWLCMYDVNGISEDALLKNYYRWRGKVKRLARRRTVKT